MNLYNFQFVKYILKFGPGIGLHNCLLYTVQVLLNFSYEIKTKPWPYSYIQKSIIVKNKIYQDMTLEFILITSLSLNKNILRIYIYILTNNKIFSIIFFNKQLNS